MPNAINRAIKSTQEKAVALWIHYRNQIRLYDLCSKLFQQDRNLEESLIELDELKAFVGDPDHILGSSLTKHGEIAEHVQVNISNARRAIQGLDKEYTFENVERLAPEDYLKNGFPVQSKFCNGVKKTLYAIRHHYEQYPSFLSEGGSYDIPKDQWEEMQDIVNRARLNPSSLSKSEYSELQAIHVFEQETGLSVASDIHSSVADYSQVQQGTVHKTISTEEKSIWREDERRREIARKETAPSVNEGRRIAQKSAVYEGKITFYLAVYDKLREGKRLNEFTSDDWLDIAKQTGFGALKGSIRGTSVYILTNFTHTSANLASSYVSAAFGVASQAMALQRGDITDDDFLINSEVMCLDIAVSTIATYLGQVAIPVPVLGGIIGNIVGEALYGIGQKYADEKEKKLISNFVAELREYDKTQETTYIEYSASLDRCLRRFNDLCTLAFDYDANVAFANSIILAREVGVPEEEILKSMADIDAFFMG